jgi:hypothetical protein
MQQFASEMSRVIIKDVVKIIKEQSWFILEKTL